MEYITVSEAAEKWGVSERSITYHLVAGRIQGAVKKGSFWLIPQDASKPEDKRRKKLPAREETKTPFLSLTESKDIFVELVKQFPDPLHICTPDGTMVFANEAFCRLLKASAGELKKIDNIPNHPNLERWGIKDFVLSSYRGEVVRKYDVRVPLQELIATYGGNTELPSGSLYHNITSFPICDKNNKLAYIVTTFTISRYYQGREEVIKGKEYIDNHWKDDFDADALSAVVHLSRHHYTRLFKDHTGMTPYHYYQNVKLLKLKEMLCNSNLSISQVFAECGVDYNGKLAKKLKQELGMTPSAYRAMMTLK